MRLLASARRRRAEVAPARLAKRSQSRAAYPLGAARLRDWRSDQKASEVSQKSYFLLAPKEFSGNEVFVNFHCSGLVFGHHFFPKSLILMESKIPLKDSVQKIVVFLLPPRGAAGLRHLCHRGGVSTEQF